MSETASNKTTIKLLALLGFFLLVWGLCYWIFIARMSPKSDLHDFVTSDEFLMSLLDKPYDGCIALSHYDDVDIIIVGNSHASANIDPFELSRLAGDKTIAVCALSAWNTDHFLPFLEFLDHYDLNPETIIWLADNSSAFEFANVERRHEFRDMVLKDQTFRNRVTREWQTQSERFELFTTQRYISRLNRMSKEISGLDNTIIRIVSQQDYIPHNENKRLALSTSRPIAQHKKKLAEMCDGLKTRNINLFVFNSPLPEQTQYLIDRFAAESLFGEASSGLDYLTQNADCIDRVIDRPLEGWGLELKHFVNRADLDDYPYEIWDSVDGFEAPFLALDTRTKFRIYDPDHLNPVGAKIFTQELWSALQTAEDRSQ